MCVTATCVTATSRLTCSLQIIRWTDGGFGMAAHNYDGDMLTDEVSQVRHSRPTLPLRAYYGYTYFARGACLSFFNES